MLPFDLRLGWNKCKELDLNFFYLNKTNGIYQFQSFTVTQVSSDPVLLKR